MNLLNFRDRIRAKAIEVGLSYSEIEGLTDVNELLNQEMPCLMFNYEQETNDFSTPSTILTPRIYLITTIFDAELTETGEYQRDWIITKKNELREKYIDWIKIMQLDGSSYIEVLNDTQLQLQQRVSVEGFLIMEALPQFKVSREFCLLTEEGGVTPPSGGCDFDLVFDCNGVAIQTVTDLDPCIENNITLESCCEPLPATIQVNGDNVGDVLNGNIFNVEVVNDSDEQVGEWNGTKWVIPPSGGSILTKTGQDTTYSTNDDGDLQRGRPTSFFQCGMNNPFGHNWRFTGITGGYNDSTDGSIGNWRDVDGNITTEALAFPDGLMIDWAQNDGTIVLMYSRVLVEDIYSNYVVNTPTTIGGYNLFVANKKEVDNVCWQGNFAENVLKWWAYDFTLNGSLGVICSTRYSATQQYRLTDFSWGGISPVSNRKMILCNYVPINTII